MKPKLVILSSVWLEPNSSAAGSRMLQLIEYFQSNNYQITYASTAQKSKFATDLSELDIKTANIEINSATFNTFIKEENPNIVLFDRFMIEEQFGWRVAENTPNAIRILDTEDLHCLRKTREGAYKKQLPFTEELLLNSDITKREIASIYRCDLSLIISNFEMDLLQSLFKVPNEILFYLPFLVNEINDSHFAKLPSYKERKHFYFIGNNLHQPNVSTVLELKKIWKSIANRLPKAELHLFGAYPTQQILQLNNPKERFFVKGRLYDINALKNYRVLLAPIPFGAGLKGKFIEAMQNGTPSVTTKTGAEGMNQKNNWSGFVTEDTSEFIEKTITLYQNEKTWLTAQKNGQKIINTSFQKERFLPLLTKKINKIATNLSKHRLHNFIGQLLLHHTLKSTKYLSKWIEIKNQK